MPQAACIAPRLHTPPLQRWCPGLKVLTYYGSTAERRRKRQGWSKPNAFHVCVTSYQLVVQDSSVFRRRKWYYMVLDEAQNIKNFQSQRWQTLLHFNTRRRLLLTGTPLQNSLMELWSLMHFLMPALFRSRGEFKVSDGMHPPQRRYGRSDLTPRPLLPPAPDFQYWFSNPMTAMVDGTQGVNQSLVQRLHGVLRPFILRRLKQEVERQLPGKYEHVVTCHMAKRQRLLYEDFMARSSTRLALASGNVMGMMNVLMQVRGRPRGVRASAWGGTTHPASPFPSSVKCAHTQTCSTRGQWLHRSCATRWRWPCRAWSSFTRRCGAAG